MVGSQPLLNQTYTHTHTTEHKPEQKLQLLMLEDIILIYFKLSLLHNFSRNYYIVQRYADYIDL